MIPDHKYQLPLLSFINAFNFNLLVYMIQKVYNQAIILTQPY